MSCFHQNRWSWAGGFGPDVAPQTTTRPAGRTAAERSGPGRLADGLDDDVDALAGRFLHGGDDVAVVVVDGQIGAPFARRLELGVAARRDDRAHAERAADLERGRRDAAADPPDERPFAILDARARDEHPVRRLVDQRERRRDLEGQPLVERKHLRGVDGDQLRVRAVAVLADDGDRVAVLHAGIENDPLACLEAADPVARHDDAGAVRAQDPWLGDGGEALAHPDVEVVERRRMEPNEHLTRARNGIRDVLDAQDLGAPVLVDPCREHGTILSCRRS